MALEIQWTAKAVSQLNDILDYLESNWTPKEIKEFISRLEKGMYTISHFPEQ